jgi:hypothetical protein
LSVLFMRRETSVMKMPSIIVARFRNRAFDIRIRTGRQTLQPKVLLCHTVV